MDSYANIRSLMGSGPGREWKQYRLSMARGEFDAALRIARNYELIFDLDDSLALTILAAEKKKPIFDPMAVRWIKIVDDRGRLTLSELAWLARTFEALRRGDRGAAQRLE
ncbi:MAG TPA: hypothetical protein VHA80_04810, partial [Solirubrobacterales bacterium]|nr:hypothetical protein [Solirubrobacterales bacterium]